MNASGVSEARLRSNRATIVVATPKALKVSRRERSDDRRGGASCGLKNSRPRHFSQCSKLQAGSDSALGLGDSNARQNAGSMTAATKTTASIPCINISD